MNLKDSSGREEPLLGEGSRGYKQTGISRSIVPGIPYEVLDGGSELPVSYLYNPQLHPQDMWGNLKMGLHSFVAFKIPMARQSDFLTCPITENGTILILSERTTLDFTNYY